MAGIDNDLKARSVRLRSGDFNPTPSGRQIALALATGAVSAEGVSEQQAQHSPQYAAAVAKHADILRAIALVLLRDEDALSAEERAAARPLAAELARALVQFLGES
jgi:hypothetical protein